MPKNNFVDHHRKIDLPENYVPSEQEDYMNEKQLEYFRRKLLSWRDELLRESKQTIDHLKEEKWQEPDLNDRATMEIDAALELRTRNRYLKLIDKIDSALERVDNGEYGYCEVTGEEIGIRRLEARPVATLSIEAQERHENQEKLHSDDD
jgi:DnaK suppressor protein